MAVRCFHPVPCIDPIAPDPVSDGYRYLDDLLLIEQSGIPQADLDKLRVVFNKLNVPIAVH